jgi:hypothetical protein
METTSKTKMRVDGECKGGFWTDRMRWGGLD